MANQRSTQDRFDNTKLVIIGYSSYLNDRAGISKELHLALLGWSWQDIDSIEYLNAKSGNPDPTTGASCIVLNDLATPNSNPLLEQAVNSNLLSDMFTFGGEVIMVNKPEEADRTTFANGCCSWSWGWSPTNDPTTTQRFHFNNSNAYGTLTRSGTPATFDVVGNGYVEFDIHGFTSNPAEGVPIISQRTGRRPSGNGGDGMGITSTGWVGMIINDQAKQTSNWAIPTDGGTHTLRLQRNASGNRVDCYIDGVLKAGQQTTPTAQWNMDSLFYDNGDAQIPAGNRNPQPWSIDNIRISEDGTDEHHFQMSRSSQWSEVTGKESIFTISGIGDSSLWYGDGSGSANRMLIGCGRDGTSYTYAVTTSSGASATARATIPADDKFHEVKVLISPSPDGVNWGDATLQIDGIVYGTEANWLQGGTNSQDKFGVQSGATNNQGGLNRISKHSVCQLQAYQDTRNYSIGEQGFDLNVIAGVIGAEDVVIDLSQGGGAEGCSMFEINLLEATQVTINITGGTIDGTNQVIVNPNNVGTVRRVYIMKDSAADDPNPKFSSIQLSGVHSA